MKIFQFYRGERTDRIDYETIPKKQCWKCLQSRTKRKNCRNCTILFEDYTDLSNLGRKTSFKGCLFDIVKNHISPKHLDGLHYRIRSREERKDPTLEDLFF